MSDWNWMTAGMTLAQEGGSEVLGAPSGPAPAGGETTGQPGAPGQTPAGAQGQSGGSPFGMMLPLLFGLMIFMVITSMFSGKKEKKKRAALLNSLKKRDKVQTVGGVIGTVVEIKPEEIVVKSEGTRLRFSRSAVQQVLKSAAGAGDEEIEEMEIENERFEDELEPARS